MRLCCWVQATQATLPWLIAKGRTKNLTVEGQIGHDANDNDDADNIHDVRKNTIDDVVDDDYEDQDD